MQEIQYIGEHLWPKNLGHFLLVLGFVSAIFSSFSYFKATGSKDSGNGWNSMGRLGFSLHGISLIAVMLIIGFIMVNKYYEYAYVSQHVNDELALKYTFSAFWEGQEGSFLLWIFWHIVLGLVILIKGGKWEAPVLSVLSLVQTILVSMLMGWQFHIGEKLVKIGSNPLLLFRDTMDIPLFQNADYVSLLSGSGLNPLLQNYWMTIHPPVTFLGFASLTIPFCYAIAGFWKSEPKAWTDPALKWSLFSGAALGIGILMGGAWAYEALTFGGYWAWDPVENMSLVPWLLMVAGIHSLLIVKNVGHGIKTSYILLSLSFIMILYSTALTRSGILGDTSVHAFTEMGLENQLVLLIGTFTLLPVILYIRKWKIVPKNTKDDKITSREFWMFIGTIVLLFSSILITASTSIPIYNKIRELFDPGFVGLVIEDPIAHYNKHQLWISLFIILLSSFAQWFRYQARVTRSFRSKLLKNLIISIVLSILFTIVANIWLEVEAFKYLLLLFAGVFGIVSNLDYFISFQKLQWKQSASVLSHLGFSIMIIGILASGLNQKYISTNAFVFEDIVEQQNLRSNVYLIKGKPMFMNGYWVEYQNDTLVGNERTYDILMTRVDSSNNVVEQFMLNPSTVYSNDLTEVVAFNPSTKHYLHKDIFTHIDGLPKHLMKLEFAREMEDTLKYSEHLISESSVFENDTLKIELDGIEFNADHPDYEAKESDVALGLNLKITDKKSSTNYQLQPVVVLRGAVVYKFHEQIDDLGLRFRVNENFFESFFTKEQDLSYQKITMKDGESMTLEGMQIQHDGFNRSPESNSYLPEEGDIAVSSKLKFSLESGAEVSLEPIYLIRGNLQTQIKAYDVKSGIHAKFTKIDPATGNLEFEIAKDNRSALEIPLEVADQMPRSDTLVLKAILFPGINLFWLGTILMFSGMIIGMILRMQQKIQSS